MITSVNKCFGFLGLTPTKNLLLVTSIWIAGALHPASGQVIYSADFEPGAFLNNTTLDGQDGWVVPPPFSPDAAVVTSDKPKQGKQTVRVMGADLDHQDFINEATGGYYDALGSYRRPVNYDTGNAQTIRISAHVRVDGAQTATGNNFYSAGISGRAETAGGGASVGEMAISSDGHVYAYSGNEDVPTFLANVPVTLGEWHSLAVVADFATQTSAFYVDNVLLTTIAWDPNEDYTGVLLRGTLHAYAAPDNAVNKKANYASTYDKFSINVTDR
jgi:hypothetical protein